MARKYMKVDSQNCIITETKEVSNNITVDGIMSKKAELERQLAEINDIISNMKLNSLDFSRYEPQKPKTV